MQSSIPWPRITVITVVFNAVLDLPRTIQSVLEQAYPNLEYFVIDGGSTDGTLNIIQEYEAHLSYWVSEPDGGIYHAMNKGIARASGEWINFMNAGDCFAAPNTLRNVFSRSWQEADLLYGDHTVVYPSFSKYRRALPIQNIWKQMPFSHQSLFAKTSLLQAFPFDLRYRFSADYDFIFRQWRNNQRFFYLGIQVACFQSGGVSDQRVLATYREVFNIARFYQPGLKVYLHHYSLILRQYLIVLLRQLLPISFFLKAMRLKNQLLSRTPNL